jgi:hypothetical protein
MEVRAVRVEKCDMLEYPGNYVLDVRREKPIGIIFLCPCGCREQWSLKFRNHTGTTDRTWEWNSCQDKPTLNPSIYKIVGCKWRGNLIDGVFRDE